MTSWRHVRNKQRWLVAAIGLIVFSIFVISSRRDVDRFYEKGGDVGVKPNLLVRHSDFGKGKQLPLPGSNGSILPQESNSNGAKEMEPACKVPKLNKDNPKVALFFGTPTPLGCNKVEEDWMSVFNGTLIFSAAAVQRHGGKIDCDYIPFWRISDDKTENKVVKNIANGTKMETDFCQVKCTGADGASWRRSFATVIPPAGRVDALRQLAQQNKETQHLDLNVYILGFDSISHMTFMRQFPKTYKLLTEELGTIVLDGYNIVGDGTPQAFIPILTGSTEVELPLTRKRFPEASYVDVYPFVWKEFASKGYATLYGEDAARFGTFTYRLKGFKEQPTDHYFRTFFQTHENDEVHHHKYACLGSVPLHKEYLRYGLDFFNNYPADVRKFSLLHYSQLTHDSLDTPQLVDGDVVEHILSLQRGGHLENTMFIVMADHGHRFAKLRQTQQGQLEERLPFFSFYLPPKFRQQYSVQYKNLVDNARTRLTTPFDIHPTLRAILDWPGSVRNELGQRSHSLWAPIPPQRTCPSAGVDDHWCTCLNWVKMATDDPQVKLLAGAVMQAINDETLSERKNCLELHLKEIISASGLAPNEKLLSYKKAKDQDGFVPDLTGKVAATYTKFQLHIKSEPGGGLFEATVELDTVGNSVLVDLAAVSRINAYGSAPKCIIDKNYFLAKWCVCPGWKPSDD